MQTGRPAKSERSPLGEKLHSAREAKGLSQKEVADHLGMAQQTYASLERKKISVRPEDLIKLSELFAVPVGELIGEANQPKKKDGPTGKARKLFEEVSMLPRHQQQHILQTVEGMLIAQKARKAS